MTIVLESFVLLSHVRRHAVPVEQSPESRKALEACLAAAEKREAARAKKAAEARQISLRQNAA